MKYNKSSLTIQEQISHIKNHYKIECQNQNLLKQSFTHINYYKLRGYWLFFEDIEKKVNFEDIINIYEFDKKLRNLFLEYIEIVESSIKSIFTNHLTTKYNNPHIHLDNSIFKNKNFHAFGIIQLANSFKKSDEVFIKHFKNKYDEELPPLWVCVEFMTFGEISKWYKNLNLEDKKVIAKKYNLRERYLTSLLLHFTDIRNISAHHSRLWNKAISKGFQIPSQIPIYKPKNFKIYHSAIMLDFLLNVITEKNNFFDRFINLIKEYNIPLKYMGFDKEHNIKELEGLEYE